MTTDKSAKVKSYPLQLAILLGLTGAGLVFGTILIALIWKMMTGHSVLTMETDMQKPQYYNAIMIAQLISTLFLFVAPAYLFAMICYRRAEKFLGFNLKFNAKQLLLIALIFIFTIPLSGALAELNKIFPIPLSWATKFKAAEDARKIAEAALININSFSKYVMSMFVIALCPAIFEETFFRGGLQNLFTRWFKGPWTAIILTSIIFSLVHISYYGFLVRAALGVILGLIFYYGKSIWLNILFHFLYNGVQVTAMYIVNGTASKKSADIEDNFPLWMGAVAILLLVYLFIKYKEASIIQQNKYPEEEMEEDDFHNWTVNQS